MNLFLLLKRISLLLLLISASLLSTSFAGRQLVAKTENNLVDQQLHGVAAHEEMSKKPLEKKEDDDDDDDDDGDDGDDGDEADNDRDVHGRLLRANSRDYGRYDPAPALVRPPFKLIPN